MVIPNAVYKWIVKQNNNLPIIALITFLFPRFFLRTILNANQNKNRWNPRKACVTLSFDCDYPEDVEAMPQLSDMLKGFPFKASFAVVGHWVEKYPREHLKVLDGGHEFLNHTYSHPDNELLNPGRKFKNVPYDEKRIEVERCHEICKKVLGYEPIGLRIPHFKNLFTFEIYSILKEMGYKYSSSTWLTNTLSHGLPFMGPEGIIEFPLTTCPEHPFTVFDTWHSLNAKRLSHRIKHRGCQSYLKLFNLLIKYAKDTNSYINIYMDPLDIKKIPDFYKMLEVLADDEISVVTYEEYINNKLFVCSHGY